MKKVLDMDPAGKKSTDPDPHPWYMANIFCQFQHVSGGTLGPGSDPKLYFIVNDNKSKSKISGIEL